MAQGHDAASNLAQQIKIKILMWIVIELKGLK